ncbi:hypothetical protein [Kiloniella sp. EL199]|uniref:hypothetical protein n=1 Tax=Kiloniella sp. EL199 TaxID=2107581 RepID=UPI000EA0406D|nr:hypothetical protein [Kiloniella sp. EL199]
MRFLALIFFILSSTISNISYAQSVDVKELERQMRSGEFTKYPPEILKELEQVNGLFDEPGMSIGYLGCMKQITTNQMKNGIVEELNQFIDHPQITQKQKRFMKKAVDRLVNLTPEEQSQICACSNKDAWNNLMTPDQHKVFNKMAQGIPLQAQDQKALQTKSHRFRPISEHDPMQCMFEPLGLYEEYRDIL